MPFAAAPAPDLEQPAELAPSLEGISEETRGVLALFGGALARIAFPDVDGAVLRRHAEQVMERQRGVATARAQLEAATTELDRGVAELTGLASRGLAYARIYAAAHPEHQELAVGLAQIDSSGRGAAAEASAPAGRRGRRRAARPELPFAVEPGGVEEVAGAGAAEVGETAAPPRSKGSRGAIEPIVERDEAQDIAE